MDGRFDDEATVLERQARERPGLAPDPLAGAVLGDRSSGRVAGHHRANVGSWIAVLLIILGFALGAFALARHSTLLWILTGVALVAGGILALASRIMEQAY